MEIVRRALRDGVFSFKLIVVLLIPAGFWFLGQGFREEHRIADILARGVRAEAQVIAARRTTRRGSPVLVLDLSWRAPDSSPLRAESVEISPWLARELVSDDRIERTRLPLSYSAEDPANPVLLDDASNGQRMGANLQKGGLGMIALGSVGTGLILLFGRSRRERAA